MFRGLGNDIIEIDRIKKVIERTGQRFLDRVFTRKEQDYCLHFKESFRHFAGRFAAKEAVVKALGTGLRDGISWLDIEITNDLMGKPLVQLSPSIMRQFNNPQILLSISHCDSYAMATAIIVDS